MASLILIRAQLLKKINIQRYGNMLKFFAEKMWAAFAVQKLLTFFQQKISEYYILSLLKQLMKWP